MAVRFLVGVGRVDGDIRAALQRLRIHGRLRHALVWDSLVVGAVAVELPDVNGAQGERGKACVNDVGDVVGVNLIVALVGHVHDVAVGPDAARAVVAGAVQLPEVLITDAFE